MDETKAFSLRFNVFVIPDMAIIPRKKPSAVKYFFTPEVFPQKKNEGK